jgi:hypothetical protein
MIGAGLLAAGCNERVELPTAPTRSTPTPQTTGVASVLVSPGAVKAGALAQGTVILIGPAPAPGLDVALSSDDDAATMDSAVTVPAGASATSFTIVTRNPTSDRNVTITASAAGRSASGGLTVWADAPVFFLWASEPGDFVGGGGFAHFTQGSSTFSATCNANSVDIRVQSATPFEFWSVQFSGPRGVPLRVGAYEGATRWPFNSATPGLSISGRSRGCNMLGGRFEIHDIDLQNNRINRFHASFVQRCDNSAGLLTGEIRLANMPASSPAASCQP